MSDKIGSAEFEVRANIKKVKDDLRRAENDIKASAGKFETTLKAAGDRGASGFGRGTRQMVKDIKLAEREIIGSSAAIGKALSSSLGVLAGGAGVAGAIALTDSYTRFANALRVAGVEGEAFATVSDHLFASAIKNGVSAESLATLYSRASQSAGELGASQSDLLKFTDGVTAALRIQGGDAASSAGALLQLSQALAGGTIHAEEFASINEGARPILEAVAKGSDRFKGSVTALRAAVYDGTVTSQEFFAAFLRGSADLEAKAAKAPLTIAASIQSLQTALVKYIGEADQSAGASAALSFALETLGKNIPLIANALATVAVILAGRYAAAVTLATVAGAMQTAELITRTAAIYGVSRAAAAGAVAMRGLSASMAFFGGPIGLAITALSFAIWGAYKAITQVAVADKEHAKAADQAAASSTAYAKAADAAALATGKERVGALESAKAARAQAIADRDAAAAKLQKARATLAAVAAANAEMVARGVDPEGGAGQLTYAGKREAMAGANVAAIEKAVRDATAAISQADKVIKAAVTTPPPSSSPSGASATRTTSTSSAGQTIEVVAIDPEVARLLDQLEYWRSVEERGNSPLEIDQNPAGFMSSEDRVAEATRAIEETQQAQQDAFRDAFTGGMMAALQGGEKGLEDWIRQGAERGLEKALNNLADLLFDLFSQAMSQGGSGSNTLGTIASAAMSIFGGPRAYGGPVTAGRAYRVGEKGPETLIAPANGMIIPAGGMSAAPAGQGRGGGGASVRLVVEASPYFDARVTQVAGPISARHAAQAYGQIKGEQAAAQKASRYRVAR